MAANELKPPQYIHEVEALLGTDFFYDTPRADALYDDFESLSNEELGARRATYIGGLAILAKARHEERTQALATNPNIDTAEWNRSWHVTPSRLGEIAMQHSPDVLKLSRRLAVLNHAERSWEQGIATEGLFTYQVPFLENFISGLQRAPDRVILPDWWQEDDDIYLQGITVTGPTGIGKTAIMARAAVSLGAGKSLEGLTRRPEIAQAPVRILTITPSQLLIGQMLGKTGKDTFRKLARNLKVGGYYQYEQNIKADVVFTSIEKFVEKFRKGKLEDEAFDFLFIDEDHHLTEPQFLRTLLNHWDGPTLGFSATPGYHERKDARNILRHEIKHLNALEYANMGILSNPQIYSLLVHPEDLKATETVQSFSAQERRQLRQEAVAKTVRDFILPFIAQGRRGLIFCEPGDKADHAKQVATLLNGAKLPSGQRVIAKSIGNFQGGSDSPKNKAIISNFNEGGIDVITTTYMGQEGFDAEEINFIVVACKVTSSLKLYQIAGRGMRKSKQFATTVLANVNHFGFGQHHYYAHTFASLFGGDVIEQGQVVKSQTTSSKPKKKAEKKEIEQDIEFPEHIQAMLDRINHKTIATAYFDPESEKREITAGYIPLHDIIAGKNISERNARYQLLRAGYCFEGRTEKRKDGHVFVRYYEPSAKTYFTDEPQPPQDGLLLEKLSGYADSNEYTTLDELAEDLDVNKKVLTRDYLTTEEKKRGILMRIATSNGRARAWPTAEANQIKERLRAILVYPPHLLPIAATAKRLHARYETVLELVRLNRQKLGVVDVLRGNRMLPGLPWPSVATLEAHYGLKKGVEPIDYRLMPHSSTDPKEKIDYARRIQRQLLPKGWLPKED